MSLNNLTIYVPIRTAQLAALRRDIDIVFSLQLVPPHIKRHMVLAIDEALTNIIQHSGMTDQEIELSLEISPAEIVARFRDDGIPFDPSHDPGQPDHTRFPKRGFGVHLIHTVVDQIEYERSQDGNNVLTLTKAIP